MDPKSVINTWLKQRQEILFSLNTLARALPNYFHDNISLNRFFQILIDYTCAGHLQIFTMCLKLGTNNLVPAKTIIDQISNSTDCIINFNEKYNKFNNITAKDIEILLEQFANRIELEDLLLNPKAICKSQIN
jgi:regulator of sigma D